MIQSLAFGFFVLVLGFVGLAVWQQRRTDGHEEYRARLRSLYDEDQDGPRDEEAW